MPIQRGIRAGVRRLFRLEPTHEARLAHDLDDEIAFHLDARVRQLVDQGWAAADALDEARRRFAGEGASFDETRRRLQQSANRRRQRLRLRERLFSLRRELGQSGRALRRSPTVALIAILTLALGLGANAAVFGIVSAVLLRSPPYADPARLVVLWQSMPSTGESRLGASAAEYLARFSSVFTPRARR